MKKPILFSLAVALTVSAIVPPVHAETVTTQPVPHIIISELQTGGASDATEEFVELYNPGSDSIDITGWLLQYRSASGTAAQTWPASTTKAAIACPTGSAVNCRVTMLPSSRAVLVHTIANIAGALTMAGGFSDKGGEIRLVQPAASPIVQDYVGYGNAADAEGTPAPAPAAGKSVKRVVDANGVPLDTGSNITDFIAGCGGPTPGQDDSASIPYATGCVTPQVTSSTQTTNPSDTATDQAPSDTGTSADQSANSSGDADTDTPAPTYLPILLTEVFPDPASPQQDSTDEFIELYNPNDTAVTLNAYRLQTGTDYRYTYTLGDTPLGPHEYLAITSAVSKLSLANSGSGVRLLDPNGTTAAEAPIYSTAKEAQSWMQDDTGWHWTLTPTPNAANVLTLPTPKVTAAPSTTNATKKTAAPKITAPKVAQPKTASAKAPAAKKTTSPASTGGGSPTAETPTIQYWLLIPLSLVALGYIIYEYRAELGRVARKIWCTLGGNKHPLIEED